MAKKILSSSDLAQEAIGKINDNFNEVYAGSANDIVGRNREALQFIKAAKKHVIEKQGVVGEGVNYRNTMNNFCIAHGSDFHSDKARWRNFFDFANAVEDINAILYTGDTPAQSGLDQTEYMMDELDAANVTKPLMLVVGNHDRYGISNAELATAYKMDERNSSIVTDFTPSGGSQVSGDSNCLYYYVDFPNNNNMTGDGTYSGADKPTPNISVIRFIVLNQYDMTITDRNKVGVPYHFTQAQLNWFISVLKNTPSTTAVVVCMHGYEGIPIPQNTGDKKFMQRHNCVVRTSAAYTGTIIEDIIEAFRTGTNINKTFNISNNDDATVTVTTDFSGTGTFIAYMIGHSHIEMIGYSSAHPNQLYLHCPCSCLTPDYNNDGVYQGSGRYSYGNEVGDMPRAEDGKTQDCFNVYGIDTINKTVTVVRVGCTTNDLGQPRDIDVYPYEQAPS